MLKRDATLSYRLLRYINSAGFGLGREIQSLRQALAMLGYQPLYRWLSLLLATASTTGYSPVLLETAVIRGRLTELLGQAFLPRGEAEKFVRRRHVLVARPVARRPDGRGAGQGAIVRGGI
ncbi:HDOD domain-containing protein [Undibacterium arcticum]